MLFCNIKQSLFYKNGRSVAPFLVVFFVCVFLLCKSKNNGTNNARKTIICTIYYKQFLFGWVFPLIAVSCVWSFWGTTVSVCGKGYREQQALPAKR